MQLLAYPRARTVEQVDDYHGTPVPDPYRWMEDLSDPELEPWLAEQTRLTEEVLGSIACRESFSTQLAGFARVPTAGTPRLRGSSWFQARTEADFDQDAVYVVEDPTDPGRLLLDPRTLGEAVITGDVEPSPDGSRLLWSESIGGSDWKTWRVLDVSSGERLPDEVGDAKLWAAWMPGGDSFIYIGFSTRGEGRTRPTTIPQLRLHRLGTPQSSDEVLYEDADDPRYFFPSVTQDGRFIVLTLLMPPGAGIAYAAVGDGFAFRRLFTTDHDLWFCGNVGDTFYICTPQDAPYGRVVAVDLDDPDPVSWRTVVPSSDLPLPIVARSRVVGDRIFVAREHLGRSRIEVHALDGGGHDEVELPGECRFLLHDVRESVTASAEGRQIFFTVTSPSAPTMLLRYDVESRSTDVLAAPSEGPALDITTEVVWAPSRDGTEIPMTIVRGAQSRSAENPPTVIEGYGGGGSSMHPYDYVPWKVAWLAAGGVVASAHLRGGGELGAEWQHAADRGGKLKAMEDFVGCAELLVDTGRTTADRLAITGRSSGAMLAAAAVINRPDLFAACVAEVGMFDPLRYHLFGLGQLMIQEYGCSDDLEDFKAMYAYSPLHNIRDGERYPAFLITVHTDDDRVAPGQGYKFAAALQAAQAGPDPILVHVRSGAGHFGGLISGEIDERADIVAFLGMMLGLPDCA